MFVVVGFVHKILQINCLFLS